MWNGSKTIAYVFQRTRTVCDADILKHEVKPTEKDSALLCSMDFSIGILLRGNKMCFQFVLQ